MRKIITVLALVATVSFSIAQEAPKATKAEIKKESCKKSKKCCHKPDASETKTTEVKK